jgi:competence protein ComEA
MFKKIVACMAMLAAASCFAAVDANKASAAELDEVKGVGPSMSQNILDARKEGEFKSWDDFMARVKGVKEKKAEKLSANGLTINGQSFKQTAATAPAAAASTAPAPASAPAAPAAMPAPAASKAAPTAPAAPAPVPTKAPSK